jgi:hypothetical protein
MPVEAFSKPGIMPCEHCLASLHRSVAWGPSSNRINGRRHSARHFSYTTTYLSSQATSVARNSEEGLLAGRDIRGPSQ